MKKNNLLEDSVRKQAGEMNIRSVLSAISGGADSIATTFALKKCGLNVCALHCNFHLRGEESNRDMAFVKNFCEFYEIPLEIREYDVYSYLDSHKGESIEQACRNLRHQWFRNRLEEKGFDRIATGHNADDNIETFFLNMLRGSGTRGLRAMIQDNGKIWRPLLGFHRDAILEYLQNNNLNFVIDSTNLQSDFRRNYLRNEIIPQLKKVWPGFNSALAHTIQNIQGENIVVENYIKQLLDSNPTRLEVSDILKFPNSKLLIKRFIDPYGPFTTTPDEIISAIKANKPHIRRWKLKNGIVFLRNGSLFVEMSHSESCS